MTRKYLLTAIIWIILHQINAQSTDNQWLVRDGVGKVISNSLINNYSNQINTFSVLISGVKFPNQPIVSSQWGNRNFSNDFLVIFEDGTFEMKAFDYATFSVPPSPNGDSYIFNSPNNKIKYMYLTNIYEEDDPPSRTSVSDNNSGSTQDSVHLSQLNNTTPSLFVNHDIVDTKDLTLIISHVPNTTCSLKYEIAGQSAGNQGLKLVPSKIFTEQNSNNSSNVLMNDMANSTISLGNEISFPLNLNTTSLFTTIGNNTFLNFSAEIVDPNIVNQEIVFSLECPSLNKQIKPASTNISGKFHDPNYVELMCVWEEKRCFRPNKKMARYKISCYNESTTGVVGGLKFHFILPPQAKPNTTTINTIYINNIKTNYLCKIPSVINGHEIEFKFQHGLDVFIPNMPIENNEFTGYIEFCVELDYSTDIIREDLTIMNPISMFETTPYPISTFIDKKTCDSILYLKENYEIDGFDCYRTEKRCPCFCKSSKYKFWSWIEKIKSLFNP